MHKPIPCKPRWSLLHEEAHPALTHTLIGLGGFLFGVLLLGALAVDAAKAPTPSLAGQVDQLKLDVAGILTRLTKLEARLTKLDGSEEPAEPAGQTLGPISSCDSLSAALPKKTDWASRASKMDCKSESIVGMPQKKFLSVIGHYQYGDNDVELQDVALQIFDLDDDTEARSTFLTKTAFEATDFNLVKRLTNTISKMDGVFTYEGLVTPPGRYIHGANWFVYKKRFGIYVHTSARLLAEKTKLDDLVSKVDLKALDAIQ